MEGQIRCVEKQCEGSDELAVTSISSDDPHFFGPRGSKEQKALEALRKIGQRRW